MKNGVKLALYRNNDLLCFLVNDALYFANTNEIEYNNKKYEVVIEKKNNKNTYIRVKEDLKIYVSTSYLTPKIMIKS